MDCLGAEISQKIKSAIRAKLVELGVYVDDELPDYIMVLVANKKTIKQMEDDLSLFLSDHTHAFVEWLQQVLDRLQTITLQGKEQGEKSGEKPGKSKDKDGKDKERKRKSSGVGSEKAKKSKSDDSKEKDHKKSSSESSKPKKDKNREPKSDVDSNKKSSKDKSEPESGKKANKDKSETESSKKNHKDKGEPESTRRLSRDRESRKSGSDSGKKSKDDKEHRSSEGSSRKSEKEGSGRHASPEPSRKDRDSREQRDAEPSRGKEREAHAPAVALGGESAGTEGRRHPRVSAPVPPAPAEPQEEDQDQDILSLSAEDEEDLSKLAPAAAAANRQSASVAPTARKPVTAPEAPPPPPPAVPASSARRVISVRQEAAGAAPARRVMAVQPDAADAGRNRSRSPVRDRPARQPTGRTAADTQRLEGARRGPQSTIGAVVCREEPDEDEGYDPLRPSVGSVASTVRVTDRPRLPAGLHPRPTLLLKAMRDAQRSTVAPVRPFLVRNQTAVKTGTATVSSSSENKPSYHKPKELFSRDLRARSAAGRPTRSPERREARAVKSRAQRANSPRDIAITVKNPDAVRRSPSPSPPQHDDEDMSATRDASEEKDVSSLEPADESRDASSDEDDNVHVTIGHVKGHPHKSERTGQDDNTDTSQKSESRADRAPSTPSPDDISLLVHQVSSKMRDRDGNQGGNSPTFVVTMTGLGASRFARSASPLQSAGQHLREADDEVLLEEEEVVEEVDEAASLRQQLLQDRAAKAAHPVVTPPVDADRPPIPKLLDRCRFWPNCTSGADCPYQHPTSPCKSFPNCKFGDKCLYIHPRCKFDTSCTRADCHFAHSAPRRLPATGVSSAAPALRSAVQVPTECRYFPNCTNPACPYIHPKLCRYGEGCTNPACLFAHPTTPPVSRTHFKWVAPPR